jgi:hypothetical protein
MINQGMVTVIVVLVNVNAPISLFGPIICQLMFKGWWGQPQYYEPHIHHYFILRIFLIFKKYIFQKNIKNL